MKVKAILTIVALLAFSSALAEDDAGNAPGWDGLSAEQQEVLGRFEQDWDGMLPERRERLEVLDLRDLVVREVEGGEVADRALDLGDELLGERADRHTGCSRAIALHSVRTRTGCSQLWPARRPTP